MHFYINEITLILAKRSFILNLSHHINYRSRTYFVCVNAVIHLGESYIQLMLEVRQRILINIIDKAPLRVKIPRKNCQAMSGCQFCFVHSISPPSRLNMMHFCLLVSYAVGREASVAVSLLNQDLIKHRIHDDALSTPCIRSDRPLFISEFGASASDTMQRRVF